MVVAILYHNRYVSALGYYIKGPIVYLLRERGERGRDEEGAGEEETKGFHGEKGLGIGAGLKVCSIISLFLYCHFEGCV